MDYTLIFKNLKRELILRNYSKRTIEMYIYHNVKFLKFIKKDASIINNNDIKNYIYYLLDKRKLKSSSVHIVINALKFFYIQIINKNIFNSIRYPKRDKKLPQILSRIEIIRMVQNTKNPKHKLIILLAYSSGLRLHELRDLKVNDVNLDNLTIIVRNGKGYKDRMTIFSKSIVNMLKYFMKYRKADDYIFLNSQRKRLARRTFEKVFENSLKKSGIKKSVSLHSLRHSFATHLMENGVDTRYIQKLLGHKRLETTAIYTHLTDPALENVKSPL